MKASVPFEFTDADRTLIGRFLGKTGMASHIECVAWSRHQLRASLTVMAQAPALPSITKHGQETRP